MTIGIVSIIREAWGGSEELWADMADKALDQGHRVIHYSLNTGIAAKEEVLIKKGLVRITRPGYIKPGVARPVRILNKMRIFLSTLLANPFRNVVEHKPDIIVYNGTCYSIANDFGLIQILQKHNTPLIIVGNLNHDRGPAPSPPFIDKIKAAYQYAKRVFFVSEKNLQTAKRHLNYAIDNGSIIRNPVNMSEISLMDWPHNEIPQLAIVGNVINEHKGHDILINVLGLPKWKARNWKLNIYGVGKDMESLKRLIDEQGLADKIEWKGKVADIRSLWSSNHLLVMPSLLEGMPLAVVETMLCGRVPVVTDVGGNTEWITDNEHGFIAKNPAVNDFDEALERAWQQKERWQQIGRNAYHRAISMYDPQAGKTFLELIKQVA